MKVWTSALPNTLATDEISIGDFRSVRGANWLAALILDAVTRLDSRARLGMKIPL